MALKNLFPLFVLAARETPSLLRPMLALRAARAQYRGNDWDA